MTRQRRTSALTTALVLAKGVAPAFWQLDAQEDTVFASSSTGRRLVRCLVAGTVTAVVALAAAVPASAADVVDIGQPIVIGAVGSYTAPSCGWHAITTPVAGPQTEKVVRVDLPAVSGVTDDQLVAARVKFMRDDAGTMVTYRTDILYTYASPGELTSTWTDTGSYDSGLTWVEDAPGESGYVGGDVQNVDTEVVVELWWASGGSFDGAVVQLANNPAGNPYYPSVCNAGGISW